MSTPTLNGSSEGEPLLPRTNTAGPSRPWWAFWRSEESHPHNRVRFADDQCAADAEEESIDGGENAWWGYKKRTRRKQLVMQIIMGVVLLILGALLGALATSKYDSRNRTQKQGPMVPPVWTLPPPTGLPRNPAYLIEASTAAVASEDKTCSDLGVSILKDMNGTAVDAAITTTLCIGLFNAFSSGIGGGGFMVVRIPNHHNTGQSNVTAIDFRETSPAGSEMEMYGTKKAGRMAAQVGGLAIGVPGELRGLELAHQMYGSLPWEDVVMPVAELAKGWFVSRELARRIRRFGAFMLDEPTWAKVYAPRGALLVEGEFVQRINYGKTLEKIAKEGASAFYEGEIADSMLKTIQSEGGIMTADDLKGYRARPYPAIHQTWNNKTIYTTDAPSSGGVMLGMLNILEPYKLHLSGGLTNPLNIHRLIEAMKFAFGARSEVADPVFARNLTRIAEFSSKEWADEQRERLSDNTTHGIEYYGLKHDTPIDHGTTHISVVDRWGGAASITSTVNLIWGSHVMCPETGVIFNDEQDDFSVPGAADAFGLWPSPWNYPAPGKKPLSSTAATIIEYQDGTLHSVFGGSGGSRIFPSLAQVILNLEAGMNLSAAIENPRVHNQIVPPITTIEVGPEGEDEELTRELRAKGHEVGVFDINLGVSEIQGIYLQNGTVWASSDSRKHGVAAGY